MSQRLIVRPEAEQDIASAARWYEERQPGLSLAFRSALDRTLATIIENPDSYTPVHRNIRRALLRRFPYGVFYVRQTERIVVLAVLHTSRDPTLWSSYLKSQR